MWTGCRTGNASVNIEAPNGGIVVVAGNTLVQGPSPQNHKIVSYGAEGKSYANNSLSVSKNSFVSTTGSIGVYDPACVPVVFDSNTFTGLGVVLNPANCIAPSALQ